MKDVEFNEEHKEPPSPKLVFDDDFHETLETLCVDHVFRTPRPSLTLDEMEANSVDEALLAGGVAGAVPDPSEDEEEKTPSSNEGDTTEADSEANIDVTKMIHITMM